MGRNNRDFDQDRAPSINVSEAAGKQKTLNKRREEEVDENAFNRSYEAWKKAGDPFYNKEKRKDNNE